VTVTVRAASPDDVPAVVALVEQAYRGEGSRAGWTTEADLLAGQRTDAAAVAELVAAPRSVVLLAEEDGALLGCCHLQGGAGDAAHLGMVAVLPTAQGQGLGKMLLEHAEDVARTRFQVDAVEMTVIVQRAELVAFYARRGYADTGARRAFPYGDERFGVPLRDDLAFAVLRKPLG